MILVALTGSIGMGKSTTAAMFAEAGLPTWDADAAVHKLYGPGGAGAAAIAAIASDAVDENGVARNRLRAAIIADPALLQRVEAVIHPLVGADRAKFLDNARAAGHAAALCDIPLLFETGGEARFDKVVVVSAPADLQRARVLERPGMTDDAFETILAKQVPDAEKRARADYIIDTSRGLDYARARVEAIVAALKGLGDA